MGYDNSLRSPQALPYCVPRKVTRVQLLGVALPEAAAGAPDRPSVKIAVFGADPKGRSTGPRRPTNAGDLAQRGGQA